jgi:hypothetical protein
MLEVHMKRRLMKLRASYQFIEGHICGVRVPYTSNVPGDIRLVDVKADKYFPDCAVFIIEHPSFDEIEELQDPPEFSAECVADD